MGKSPTSMGILAKGCRNGSRLPPGPLTEKAEGTRIIVDVGVRFTFFNLMRDPDHHIAIGFETFGIDQYFKHVQTILIF